MSFALIVRGSRPSETIKRFYYYADWFGFRRVRVTRFIVWLDGLDLISQSDLVIERARAQRIPRCF